ncbi:MAG: hypothetical protein R6X22_02920, partial [Gemmatimonadota bacterium]
GRRDPIGLFEEHLATGPHDLGPDGGERTDGARDVDGPSDGERESRNREALARVEAEVIAEVDAAAEEALASRAADERGSAEVEEGVYG